MKVRLDFKSPVLIGGINKTSNFIESDEVIKGSVVRAAFAKVILDNCFLRKPNDYTVVNGKRKYNWVYLRDKEGCKECEYKSICEKFSNIKFSYFYPKDTEIIPLTAQICKQNDEHGFIDILTTNEDRKSKYKNGCPECGGRLEFKSGLRIKGDDGNKVPYAVAKVISVKNAINPYTKTSADGMLYSIEAVESTNNDIENPELIYEGYIENMTIDELSLFKRLRVGGDISVGYGKCILNPVDETRKEILLDEVKEFSDSYKCDDKDRSYLAIKFIGDCRFNFDKIEGYLTTDEFKNLWRKPLEICDRDDILIEKIYTDMESYRGYDNSLETEDKREDAETLIVRGTVIVFSSKMKIDDLYAYFREKKLKGFGVETENGFGEFEFYIGR